MEYLKIIALPFIAISSFVGGLIKPLPPPEPPIIREIRLENPEIKNLIQQEVKQEVKQEVNKYVSPKWNTQPKEWNTQPVKLGADASQPAALVTYYLSGSGISSSATSLTLTSFTLPQSGYKIQDADLSDTFYLTFEPGNRTRQEIASCTTVVQNSAGTATLSGCTRGLSPIQPYTASTTLRFAHAGGSTVIFSDPPQLFNEFANKANNINISGVWNFQSLPTTTVTCTSSTQFCNKAYMDALALQGAATSTEDTLGLVRLPTTSQMGIASSTSGAPFVLPSRMATSSSVSGAGYIPLTDSSGKISANFMATSSQFTFATTTITTFRSVNATTTSFGVDSGKININGIQQNHPSNQGASSTALFNDGSGNLTWNKLDWREMGATTTVSASPTTGFDLSLLNASSTNLHIDLFTTGWTGGAENPYLRFNGDTNNYSYTVTEDLAAVTTSYPTNGIGLLQNATTTAYGFFSIDVHNEFSQPKFINWKGTLTSSDFMHNVKTISGSGVWNNSTSTITSLNFAGSNTRVWNAGTSVRVMGNKD